MRFTKMTWSLVAGAFTLSVFGVAAARTGSVFGLDRPVGLLGPSLFGATADIQTPRVVNVPPAEQVGRARQYVTQMEQSTVTVRTMLDAARAARDVVKSLCLNDKLNQLDVAVRSARDREALLKGAAHDGDQDRAHHEFMMLQVLNDRVQQLVKEANQCIGEEIGTIGDTQVSVQVDPTIPDNNPGQLGADTAIITDTPVVSSQTM